MLRLQLTNDLLTINPLLQKLKVVRLIDELHLKLRKVETSGEESSLTGRASNVVALTSPVTSASSKFYKNLKKIKRNHGTENPTKNYYLAFPALSSKKTSTTITNGGGRMTSPGEIANTRKDSSNLQLLSWSNLMSKEKNIPTVVSGHEDGTLRNVVKMKTPIKKRRYGRTVKNFSKSDVQCNAKSYDGAAFSPKPKNVNNKKHQRNQFGKSFPPFAF